MISQTLRDGLNTERKNLEARRDAAVADINARIAAIDLILAPDNQQQSFPFNPPKTVARIAGGPKAAALSTNTGLSADIQSFIRGNPGVNKDDILSFATKNGHESRGKTSLPVLITSELWRLCQKGTFMKVGKQFYSADADIRDIAK